MNLLNQKRELGSLAAHRAFLGKPPKKGSVVPFPCEPRKVFAAQVAGLAKRLKAIRSRDVVIGLSGGIDSALVATVAADALGADNVLAVMMPTRISWPGSRTRPAVSQRIKNAAPPSRLAGSSRR